MYGNSTMAFSQNSGKNILDMHFTSSDKGKKVGTVLPPADLLTKRIRVLLPRFILHISGVRHLELGGAGQIVHDP
jgi:hypothetical protein